MALNPLDTTTVPAASQARRIQGLNERIAALESSRRGIGTIVAGTYAEAKAQLPAVGADGQMILAKGGFNPVLFVYDAGESESHWYAIKASEA
jgi:hypothetical protein